MNDTGDYKSADAISVALALDWEDNSDEFVLSKEMERQFSKYVIYMKLRD